MTYGAIVRQLLTDYEEIDEVNKQLDTMYVTIIIDCIPLFFLGVLVKFFEDISCNNICTAEHGD